MLTRFSLATYVWVHTHCGICRVAQDGLHTCRVRATVCISFSLNVIRNLGHISLTQKEQTFGEELFPEWKPQEEVWKKQCCGREVCLVNMFISYDKFCLQIFVIRIYFITDNVYKIKKNKIKLLLSLRHSMARTRKLADATESRGKWINREMNK